jgi:hypothetical protein
MPMAEHARIPRRRLKIKLRRTLHRLVDPIRSLPNQRRASLKLRELPDGEYRAPVEVPYVPQFASPALIRAYIHDGLHGQDDPNWAVFGATDPALYTFWAHRACAIAVLKMAVDAYGTSVPRSMWDLVQQGLALGGYLAHDAAGQLVDEGWFYPALEALGAQHGLHVRGMAYASALDVCLAIREGWLVAPAVTPEIGERGPLRRYDGHFVLAYGFTWQAGRPSSLLLHNPSGRYPELQAGAVIPFSRFRAAFAHRFMAFRPVGADR